MTELVIADEKPTLINPDVAFDKLLVGEQPKVVHQRIQRSRLLVLGLLGGLVVGAGSLLIADQRSNRVFFRRSSSFNSAIPCAQAYQLGHGFLWLCRSWWVSWPPSLIKACLGGC